MLEIRFGEQRAPPIYRIAAINDVQHLKQLHGCDTSSSIITHLARKTCRLPCRPSIYCVY